MPDFVSSLREEHRLRALENKVLRAVLVPKVKDVE
jgi:hypothetical protein